MSRRRLEQLSRRKQDLIFECAEQRSEVASAFGQVRSSVKPAVVLHAIGKILRAHPMLTAGISSLLASGYAGALGRSGGELLRLLRVARPLWTWLSRRRGE
ncbi:MAG TPA: hypothetical protein VIB79_21565 [Candidatus Binatia bacterium]|jgi:hypothetical protein